MSSIKYTFDDINQTLCLDEVTQKDVLELLSRFNGVVSDEKKSKYQEYWDICAIYLIACKAVPSDSTPYVSLSQCLETRNLALCDLFDPLTEFIDLLKLDCDNLVTSLKTNYLHIKLLFGYYERWFGLFFDKDLPRKNVDPVSFFNFGWSFFLISKDSLFSDILDFNQSFLLLITCIDFLVVQAPDFLRKISLSEIFDRQPNTLEYVCASIPYEITPQFKTIHFELHENIQKLAKERTLKWSGIHAPFVHVLHYYGSIAEMYLEENLKNLTSRYKDSLRSRGGFDEYLCVENHSQLLSPNQKRPFSPNSTHLHSSQNENWLRNIAEKSFTSEIQTFYGACDEVNTDEVDTVVTTIIEEADFFDNERKLYAKTLYQFLLLGILNNEKRKREGSIDFAKSLLKNHRFHISLLSVAMEVVRAIFILPVDYKLILKKAGVTIYEFTSVIMRLQKLNLFERSIIKGLFEIVERVLLCYIWKGSSPVYQYIDSLQITERQELFINSVVPPNVDKNVKTYLHLLNVSFSVAKVRARDLLEKIREKNYPIRDGHAQQVNDILLYIMVQKPSLLKDRKIDTIIMCIIHGICKANGANLSDITFSIIISAYKNQPQNHNSTYKKIFISDDNPEDDIISFNNNVFVVNDICGDFITQRVKNTTEYGNLIQVSSTNITQSPRRQIGKKITVTPLGIKGNRSNIGFSSPGPRNNSPPNRGVHAPPVIPVKKHLKKRRLV